MAPALYLLYTYLGMGGLYTCIGRGIIVLLLGKGSREPQDSGKRWFSRFFYLLTDDRRGQGGSDTIECHEI